jgi:hypothetical protein
VAVRYEVVTSSRAGKERVHSYSSEAEIEPGDVLRVAGRDWLVAGVETGEPPRAVARPARYRLRMRHPDGREELGAFRRYRPDGPTVGHGFTTIEEGAPVSWQVAAELLASDDENEPYLELVAERDFGEFDELPHHELEHALAPQEPGASEAAEAMARAEEAGLAVELVALEAGEEPDWESAASYIDALILEEIEDDLLELCGVNPNADGRDTWLATVKERLLVDLARFRADVEGDHAEIQVWDFRDGRVFASVGAMEDEADPLSGHGWLCRLLDASALGAAGFERVRKAEL